MNDGRTKNETDPKRITKEIPTSWLENITEINLSGHKITSFNDQLKMPCQLSVLNLSNNLLKSIPSSVMILEKLKTLDLSNNQIVFFNNTPSFCHNIVYLNLSKNLLRSPPYWVWIEQPKNLEELNISDNENIINCMKDINGGYLLQLPISVRKIVIYNCAIKNKTELNIYKCFQKTKELIIGIVDYTVYKSNQIIKFPCTDLNVCCDMEIIDLSNTCLYHIDTNINIYRNLLEINLSMNNISSLPKEFCSLVKLETCILSYNKLMYLPDEFKNMTNLVNVYLDYNKIIMLPDGICNLPKLRLLDIYGNYIDCLPGGYSDLEELDFAQNYFDEPDDQEYLDKKSKYRTRRLCGERVDGNLTQDCDSDTYEERSCSIGSSLGSSWSLLDQETTNNKNYSEEDWDSDDYLEPSCSSQYLHSFRSPSPATLWKNYVIRKMAEGNFCPVDMHTVPIMEQVLCYKARHPQKSINEELYLNDTSDDDSV